MAVDLNYGIGVEGKNLVLKTLGRVYVKVKDRKYELVFRPEDLQKMIEQYGGDSSSSNSSDSSIIVYDNVSDMENSMFPGNDKFVILKDGGFYITENNNYTRIPLAIDASELSLDTLYISNAINFTGVGPFFSIPTTVLNTNLNADLLDGRHSTDFAIKNQNETINGSWTFKGSQTLEYGKCLYQITDRNGNLLILDFTTGTITCKKLIVDSIETTENLDTVGIISGIGNEIWVGTESDIDGYRTLDETEENGELYNISLIESGYIDGSLYNLDDAFTIDFWYNFFFTSYNIETNQYILKDFTNQNIIQEANNSLKEINKTYLNYLPFIVGFRTDLDASSFTGREYLVDLKQNVPTISLLPNMIFTDDFGNIGYVVSRERYTLKVKMLNENTYLNGSKLIVIGDLTGRGSIKMDTAPSIALVKDPLDPYNPNKIPIYFGELSRINENASGIGMILKGTYPTNLVPDNTLDNIRNYQHTSEINIENSYLKWGDNITIFNEDGSGYLSKGQIRWSSNNDLIIDGSDIANSRINNTGITNSSFQSGNILINTDGSGHIGDKIEFNTTTVTKNTPMGPAGGDLTGQYPNPTINDGAITTNKIANGAVTSDKITNSAVTSDKLADGSVTTNKIVNNAITSDKIINSAVTIAKLGSDVINRFTTIETDIDTIESNISNLQNDVSDLQNTVADLSSTVDSHTTSINNLGTTVSNHSGAINNLQLQVNGQREDITDLEQRVTTLENTVGTLNTTLENRLNGN